MKYLLDTHAFIWYATGDKKLSEKAKKIIDSSHERYLSIASIWEMAIKINIGKLTFMEPFQKVIENQIEINNYRILPLTSSHLFKLAALDLHHRDPFDRVIICQALIEDMPVLTVDKNFAAYDGVLSVW